MFKYKKLFLTLVVSLITVSCSSGTKTTALEVKANASRSVSSNTRQFGTEHFYTTLNNVSYQEDGADKRLGYASQNRKDLKDPSCYFAKEPASFEGDKTFDSISMGYSAIALDSTIGSDPFFGRRVIKKTSEYTVVSSSILLMIEEGSLPLEEGEVRQQTVGWGNMSGLLEYTYRDGKLLITGEMVDLNSEKKSCTSATVATDEMLRSSASIEFSQSAWIPKTQPCSNKVHLKQAVTCHP